MKFEFETIKLKKKIVVFPQRRPMCYSEQCNTNIDCVLVHLPFDINTHSLENETTLIEEVAVMYILKDYNIHLCIHLREQILVCDKTNVPFLEKKQVFILILCLEFKNMVKIFENITHSLFLASRKDIDPIIFCIPTSFSLHDII